MRSLVIRRPAPIHVISFAAIALVVLAVLSPSGAKAAPSSLKVASNDSRVLSSCELTLQQFNHRGVPATVRARLTVKAAQIKVTTSPIVSSINVTCVVYPPVFDAPPLGTVSTFRLGPFASKTEMLTLPVFHAYTICLSTDYSLRGGGTGEVPHRCAGSTPS